ncbi:signal peptidase I [Streptomyces sp. Sge12]|nr:signal peptidase I [Streptomyces sp. Sge12]
MRSSAGPRAAASVVRPRAWGGRHLSVERVIAVGGDRIAHIPGDRKLTLNGKPLDEPYVLNGDPVAWTPGALDVKVPEGRLFLLGDTRGNSADSRYRFEVSEGGTAPLPAVKGELIGEDDPLVVGLRSALPAGGGAVLAGVVAGVAALRLRRRTMTAGAAPADTVRVSGDRVPAELPARTSDRIPPVLKQGPRFRGRASRQGLGRTRPEGGRRIPGWMDSPRFRGPGQVVSRAPRHGSGRGAPRPGATPAASRTSTSAFVLPESFIGWRGLG